MAIVDLGKVTDEAFTLFSGDTISNVSLSQSSRAFDKLEIRYCGYNGTSPKTLIVYSPYGKRITLDIVEDSANTSGGTRLRRATYDIGEYAITLSSGFYPGYTLLNGATVSQSISSNPIHITEVTGYVSV